MNSKFTKRSFTVLLLFGIIGQIAWAVENMYFNLFVFDTIEPNLNAITLMVQSSGIAATVATLIAGTVSDKLGNRRSFISIGYIIWGITVMLFGFIAPEYASKLFGISEEGAVRLCLITVIVGDCIMTLFGSSANDAAFSSWVTDNTDNTNRGRIESIVAIFPLLSLLIVAGGFGIIKEAIGYRLMFLLLGAVISISGIAGIFIIRDSDTLRQNGTLRDMLYGFKPSVIKSNTPFYMALLITCIYSIACQVFMPYLIIYMTEYLHFEVIEYSLVFGLAILLGATVNLFLGKLSDKVNKINCMYVATAVFAAGLFAMYLSHGFGKLATIMTFGISGFVMICGYIYISALTGAIVRDYTPKEDTGKLQGVRMLFFVLIPMLVGPAIGNAINAAKGERLSDQSSADTMTTLFIPASEIFLAGALISLILFALIPILSRLANKSTGDK